VHEFLLRDSGSDGHCIARVWRGGYAVVESKVCTNYPVVLGKPGCRVHWLRVRLEPWGTSNLRITKYELKTLLLPRSSLLYQSTPQFEPNGDLIQRSLVPWLAHGRWESQGCNAIRSAQRDGAGRTDNQVLCNATERVGMLRSGRSRRRTMQTSSVRGHNQDTEAEGS
jgi:hypothetical protein